VSHIDHEESAYFIGNFAHAGVIPLAAVSATTTDNQFWFVLKSQFLHLVVVYTACFLVRVKKVFGAEYANVQPHSGAQANAAVLLAVLKPGDTFM